MKDFKKYKRFFAFGCSMTSYYWPTWADIIAQEIPTSYNYGKSGGGNLFIASQITEANQRFKFDKDDLVMVMWSSIHREDRYIKNHWETPGNIYTQGTYSDKFVKQFADERGYFIRDISMITMASKLLETTGADFHMLKMCEFEFNHSGVYSKNSFDDVRILYADVLEKIKPDILTVEFNGVWPVVPIRSINGQTADYHPTTQNHANYLKKIFPELEFSSSTNEFIDAHMSYINKAKFLHDLWPTWQQGNPPRL